MKKLFLAFLLGPFFPIPSAAFTVVSGAVNNYMVENTSGTDPSGNVCYDFMTRPGCSAFISGISTSSFSNLLNSSNTWTGINAFASTTNINGPFCVNGNCGSNGQAIITTGSGITFTSIAGTSSTNTWTAQQTFTAFIIPSSGIAGVTSASNAAAGAYGEYISSVTTSKQNYPTTTQYGDLVVISLTAGDWDVTGSSFFTANGATVSESRLGISTTAGNSATGLVNGSNLINSLANMGQAVPAVRISLSSPSSVFLKYFANYSGGPPQAEGRISARRVR